MQALCSRAAQAHICPSRPYTHILHRTITRTAHGDISTALHATNLDPVAVPDAYPHDGSHTTPVERREESRTSQTRVRKGPTISRQHVEFRQMRPRVPMGAIEALNSICDTEEALTRYEASGRNFRKFLRSMHRSYSPDEAASSGFVDHLGSNLAAIQLAVDQEQRLDDGVEGREPMTSLQFERYHSMVNAMVDRLIAQSYHAEFPNDPGRAQRNFESLDSAWTAIRMLRSEGYPRYNHPSVDPLATKQARDQLADKLRTFFEAWGSDRAAKPKFQVAKICYNLLVCPVPPSMHHYNLLLVGFLRKAHYSLGDVVVESFLENSRLRPTPQTHVCLLNHYRKKRDIKGFYHIIRRMMALDNRGILIRRRWFKDVAEIPALHQWAQQAEVTTSLQANWVIERPSLGQDIYEALVSGLLGFGRVKDAVKVFIGSLQEKIGVSVELFIYLLKQCLYALDASATAILSQGLIDNADVVVSLLLRDNCPQRLVEHLYPVLTMDEPPSLPMSEHRAQMIWNSTTLAIRPQDGLARDLRRIKTAMFIRQTETYLGRLGKRSRLINQIFRIQCSVERTVLAEYCTGRLTRLQERLQELSRTTLKHQTLQKTVRMLEQLTWDLGSPETLARTHKRVSRVLGENIPRPAEADSCEQRARLERIATIADDWFHYRISKTRGTLADMRRLMLYCELKMITGRRLMMATRQLLRAPVDFGWRRLDLVRPETPTESGQEQQSETGQGEAAAARQGRLWRRAETGAVSTGDPAVPWVRVA